MRRPLASCTPFRVRLERACRTAGLELVLVAAGARSAGALAGRLDVAAFERARSAAWQGFAASPPDRSAWSAQRLRAFAESLATPLGAPLAVLSVPALDLLVPVYADTSELHLDRGAGLIE